MGQKERLRYLLKQLFPNTKFPIPEGIRQEDEYQYLYDVLKAGKLSTAQIQKVFQFLTQEAISHVLSLPRAGITYDSKFPILKPDVLSLSIRSMVRAMQNHLRNVVKLKTVISSPFSRLQLKTPQSLDAPILDIESCFSLNGLHEKLAKNFTLYELSLQTNQKISTLGNLIKPLVSAGDITVTPYREVSSEPNAVVACIDDSRATQRIVKMTLEGSGFQVIGLTNPAQALSTFVHERPDVILMDINMPDINGYELCRMLNQSQVLKSIPVIMLTGRDGLLDRMRARMVGSTDYLAKPFKPEELISLVDSYVVKSSSVQQGRNKTTQSNVRPIATEGYSSSFTKPSSIGSPHQFKMA